MTVHESALSSEPMSAMAESTDAVMKQLHEVRDAMRVGRVFGAPYESDGATIIPAARISGGGGGGGGREESDGESGGGFGTGFGLHARPVGALLIDRDGTVSWRPTADATLLARGAQMLAGVIAVCVTLVLLRRR